MTSRPLRSFAVTAPEVVNASGFALSGRLTQRTAT